MNVTSPMSANGARKTLSTRPFMDSVWKAVLEDLLPTPPESPSADNVVIDSPVTGEVEVEVGISNDAMSAVTDSETLRFPRWNGVELSAEQHNRVIKCQSQLLLPDYIPNYDDDPVTVSKCPLVKDCMWSQPLVIPADVIFAELSRRIRSCRPTNLPVRVNHFDSGDISSNLLTNNSWNIRLSKDTGTLQNSPMTASCYYSERPFCGQTFTGDDSDNDCQILSDDDVVNVEFQDGVKDGTDIAGKNGHDLLGSAEERQQIRLVEHLDEIHSYCYKERKPGAEYKRRHIPFLVRGSLEHLKGAANESTACQLEPPMECSSSTGFFNRISDPLNTDKTSYTFNSLEKTRNEGQVASKLAISCSNKRNKKRCSQSTSKRKGSLNNANSERHIGKADGYRYRRLQHNVLERNRRQDTRKQFLTLQTLLIEYDQKMRRAQRTNSSMSARMARVEILDRAAEVVKELEYSDRKLMDTFSWLSASNKSLEMRISPRLAS